MYKPGASDHVLLAASALLPRYAALIHYIQHLLRHIIDMPYTNNSRSLKGFKDELKPEIISASTRVKSAITSQDRVVYQRPLVGSRWNGYVLVRCPYLGWPVILHLPAPGQFFDRVREMVEKRDKVAIVLVSAKP